MATSRHAHFRNAVMLVWGSLRLAPNICLAITKFMNIIVLQLKNNIDVKCKEKQALDDLCTHFEALKAHLHDAAGKYLKKWQVA